jgi:nucleoside-diphosphate-sugar epimerase
LTLEPADHLKHHQRMTRVLLTGATGFVGAHLGAFLADSSCVVRAALRTRGAALPGVAEVAAVGDIGAQTDWRAALDGVDTVIHAAARAHRPAGRDPEEPYLEVNARGTQTLARAAAQAGVRRFIYLSSIKVNGEGRADRPYSAADDAHPSDGYARSKWAGERYLREIAEGSMLQGVVVRAPLVYGPGVKGNFLQLLRWVHAGRPLPLGGIANARSLVSLWNLCDLLRRLIEHPAAPGGPWLVSDGEDLSTPELVRRIARAMGRPIRLPRVPAPLLRLAGELTGRGAQVRRLCDSLTVDIGPTRSRLGWSPPMGVNEALEHTVRWYVSSGVARRA